MEVGRSLQRYTGSQLSLTRRRDPKNRKLRVLTIGGGVTGILMAYQIQKLCENVEHVIYEKNAEIGGTWYGDHNAVLDIRSLADLSSPAGLRTGMISRSIYSPSSNQT